MIKDLQLEIEKLLQSKIVSSRPVGGGCINNGMLISTEKKKNYFVKYNSPQLKNMFECEVNGLQELEKSETIRVPRVIGVGGGSDHTAAFLVLEQIKSKNKHPRFYQDFGRKFAQLHKYTGKQFGFFEDNYIGSTPQKNEYRENWVTFFVENRLLFQVRLAEQKRLAPLDLSEKAEKLAVKLPSILATENPPSLLHGDLWSGNYMTGNDGMVVLIDPAAYYGDREADLAMTEMFGSLPSDFYHAYNEEYPLVPGYDERKQIYKLYHYLNHLNLFGTSYLGSCLSILKHFM